MIATKALVLCAVLSGWMLLASVAPASTATTESDVSTSGLQETREGMSAGADAPSPEHCVVEPCDALGGVVLAPSTPHVPISDVRVVVRNAANAPMAGYTVRCEFGAGVLCSEATLTGTTNTQGEVRFRFVGGGCEAGSEVLNIVVSDPFDMWTIRSYGVVKSPDFDGAADGQVDLADLLSFSNEFLGSAPPDCHDYDNDGSTDLGDLLIMSVAFEGHSHCP